MIPVCRLEDSPRANPSGSTPPRRSPCSAPTTALYAVNDTCTHQDASLSEGWLEGCLIECPLHAAAFDLRTGAPTCPPARHPLRTHLVTVDDAVIHVHVTVREGTAA